MTKVLYEDIYKEDFSFWKNWQDFLKKLNDEKLESAKTYLVKFIWWVDKIKWKTIIDFWSWSWVMSLAFALLWAKVLSIDIDDESINCTKFLKHKYKVSDDDWKISKWSVLDKFFIDSLWKFDLVYSWWVIHHSWSMWEWLENIKKLIKNDWLLYLAIYNKSEIFL